MARTKILIVDDKRENILALESLISTSDVEILSAMSGQDALALLLAHEFGLAILDVQMPEMSGFDLARLMRTAERSKSIPIIFVTASQGTKSQIFEGYDKGAVDYMLKPLDPQIVRSKVRVFVELDQKTKALSEKSRDLELKLKEMDQLRESAELANQAKSRFIANISHEIRTPLGAVLGYAELLKLPDQSPEDRENFATAIASNGQVLLKLVDEILDLAKVEAEKIEVQRVRMSLAQLIFDLKAVHVNRALDKSIRLNMTADGTLPRYIDSDPVRLKQILNNIIGNALKFTDHGSVDVHFSYEHLGKSNRLRILVKDSGCGIAGKDAARLFQPFMQVDNSSKRQYGGTGLGLVISRQLAKLLGGDVVLVDSNVGTGSTFAITIDIGPIDAEDLIDHKIIFSNQVTETQAKPVSSSRLDDICVLVVDDAMDNRNLIRRMLTLAGAKVELAESGEEAVHRAMNETFDVILMDLQMPGMDGYEATTMLRDRGYKRPIIALTAHTMKEDMKRCLEVGFDQHMRKPVDREGLLREIAEYAKRTHP